MFKIRTLLFVAIFYSFCTNLHAQFSTPKVAADTTLYYSECRLIIESGVMQRNDFKYIIRDGKVTSERYKERIVQFDELGRIKEFLYLDEQGRKKAIIVFSYYSNSLPKSESQFHPTGEMLSHTNYSYNSNLELTEKVRNDQYGNVIDKVVYESKEDDNTITEKKYPYPNAVSEKNIWVYDNKSVGRITEHLKFNGESDFLFKHTYIYEDGKLIKEVYTNPAGNLAFYLEYTYDIYGNIVEIEKVKTNETRLKNAIFNYNTAKLLLGKITYDRNGQLSAYYKYEYK